MKFIPAVLFLALALVIPAQAQDAPFFRLGANFAQTTNPPPLDPDFTDLIGSFAYPDVSGQTGEGVKTADPTAFTPNGLTIYGYAWADSDPAALLNPVTGRISWNLDLFNGTRTATVVAYTAPDFSEGMQATSSISVSPADDLPDPEETGDLTYAPLSVAFGHVYTASPILAPGLTAYEYGWNEADPPHATIDPVTGVVTWDATAFTGTLSGSVYAITRLDDPDTLFEDEQETVGGTSKITVTGGAYDVVVSPDDFSVQWGTTGLYQTFTASTVPAQPTSGEVWDIEYQGSEDWLTVAGNVATYDSDSLYASGNHPGPYEWSNLHEKFRFKRTASGVTAYGDWVDFEIGMYPYFDYAGDGAGYKVFINDHDPSAAYIQVLAGATVDIPAVPRLNASLADLDFPTLLSQFHMDLNLPPGLTLNADGSISGTVTGAIDLRYPSGNLSVVDGSGTIYGMNEMNVAVVNSFRPTIEDFFQIPESEDDDPGPGGEGSIPVNLKIGLWAGVPDMSTPVTNTYESSLGPVVIAHQFGTNESYLNLSQMLHNYFDEHDELPSSMTFTIYATPETVEYGMAYTATLVIGGGAYPECFDIPGSCGNTGPQYSALEEGTPVPFVFQVDLDYSDLSESTISEAP